MGKLNQISAASNNVGIVIPMWLMFILIFINSDTFFFALNPNGAIESFPRYLAIAVCFYLFARMCVLNRIKMPFKQFILYVVTISFVYASSIINNDNVNRTFTTIIFITEGLLLANLFVFEDVFRKFEKVMYFLAVSSIVIWLIAVIFPSIIMMFPMVSPENSRIYNLFLGGVFEKNLLSGQLVRSQSIFWEPGVFQIYLNIALSYLLLYQKSFDSKRIVVYVIALLLTFSTASIVTTIFLFAVYAFFKKVKSTERHKKSFLLFLLLTIVGCLVLYIGIDIVFDTYFLKVIQEGHGSTAMRLGSLVIGLYLTFLNPVFGIGAVNLGELFKYYMLEFQFVSFSFTYSFTNTMMYFFSVYGIPVGLFFLIGNYKFTNYYSDSFFYKLAVFLWIFLLYVDESLNSSVWPWVLCFFGWFSSRQHTKKVPV